MTTITIIVLLCWLMGAVFFFLAFWYFLEGTGRNKNYLHLTIISIGSWISCLILLIVLIDRVTELEKKVKDSNLS